MNEAYDYFLLFPAIHDVLKAEKRLKSEKIKYELVPIPRQLSSNCGVCIKVKNFENVLNLIGTDAIEACYIYDGREFREIKK